MKAQETTTAALTVSNVSDAPGPEFEETYMWPLITAKGKIKRPAPAATSLKNRFDAFGDKGNGPDGEDDDETEMIKALSMITSNIKIKNKKSKGMTMARIASIAQRIAAGDLKLPGLDLGHNDENDCCWALVDSGAAVNVARKGQFAKACPAEAPPIILTTANGAKLPNSGAVRVVKKSKEGSETSRIFYEAPVEMPILAVAELTKEGPVGSTTGFRQRDGYVENVLRRAEQGNTLSSERACTP